MGLNTTPKSDRIHIGIFGKRNAGKSSLINAITGQDLAVVSHIKGTTTDPVSKAMELLPLGPVVIIDTPGLDDEGELGQLRVKKAYQVLNKTDIALLVTDGAAPLSDGENQLIGTFKEKQIPYIIAVNKADATQEKLVEQAPNVLYVSAKTGENIHALKELMAKQAVQPREKPIVSDLLRPNDIAVLVVPIDSSAPKGRLILPQQQTIRDILEADAVSVVTKETALPETLEKLGTKPRMVITDSQAFQQVAEDTPEDIPLTSFSILFARHKGDLYQLVKDVRFLDVLCSGDKVLIAEGCTHHRQCNDIGTVKIPGWIQEYTGSNRLQFEFTSGTDFPDDLTPYRMVVHCGGCMLNQREMQYRMAQAKAQKVPIVNYGILIAYVNGILKRSVELFPEVYHLL